MFKFCYFVAQTQKHGLKWHVRTTGAFTPIRDSTDYLMLSLDPNVTRSEIEKFSKKDAQVSKQSFL